MVLPTLDDLPQDKANCATCTRQGGICQRGKENKKTPNGYIRNSATGEICGMIASCLHYTGPFKK